MFKGLSGPTGGFSSTAGALKRSDANLDSPAGSEASPVAKRRSVHGTSSFANASHDAHVFDRPISSPRSFDIHDDSNQEYQLASSSAPFIRRDTQPSPTPSSSVARRASSLRKSTLQQRYGEKSSWGRRAGAQQLAQMSNEPSTPTLRSRPRITMDSFVPPLPRDSPFSATGPLPQASLHPLPGQLPHPLSRSIKPSSSGGNVQEDTPMKFSDQSTNSSPDLKIDPFRVAIGPGRGRTPANLDLKSHTPAAPQGNGRTGMFVSAGLVSKVNRDPEEDNKGPVVPDTPCKKSSTTAFATYPPLPGSAVKFGRSSSGFSASPRGIDDTFGCYGQAGKGLNLFHRMGRRPQRRASVLDLKDQSLSPIAKDKDPLTTTPEGLPPTPTKLFFNPVGAKNALESPSANRHTPPTSAVKRFTARAPSCT